MIVQRFLHWLETAPKSSRAKAAAALARASLNAEMPEGEREAADAALTLLLDDPSPKVRYAIADAVASHADAPRHLILALARDQSDIAMLVLCRSPLFLDSELIEIAGNGDVVTLTAIACRQPVSNRVATAIIAADKAEACLALLQNPALKMSAQNLREIARRFGTRAEIREALLAQPELPADARQILIAGLSSALQELVTGKCWLGSSRAERVVREARDQATAQLAKDVSEAEIPAFVEHLRISEQLTAAFLLRALCCGNIELFVAAIANLTEIPENRIKAVLQQGRTAAFRAIYDRSSLPKSAIPAITAAVDIWKDEYQADGDWDDVEAQRRIVDRIIDQYHRATDTPDEDLLALLRRISAELTREAALLRVREITAAA